MEGAVDELKNWVKHGSAKKDFCLSQENSGHELVTDGNVSIIDVHGSE
jgi:hypothetical protein